MTRLKISRNNREERKQLLQAKLSTSLIEDINLICKWSGNEKSYVIGELLQYALSMEPDFQAYKQLLSSQQPATTAAGHRGGSAKKDVSAERASIAASTVAK
jgi:hypothetical protein